jgi:hypothetical protein
VCLCVWFAVAFWLVSCINVVHIYSLRVYGHGGVTKHDSVVLLFEGMLLIECVCACVCVCGLLFRVSLLVSVL